MVSNNLIFILVGFVALSSFVSQISADQEAFWRKLQLLNTAEEFDEYAPSSGNAIDDITFWRVNNNKRSRGYDRDQLQGIIEFKKRNIDDNNLMFIKLLQKINEKAIQK